MDELHTTRRFEVDDDTLEKLRDEFVGAWVDNDTCLRTIGAVQREKGYLMDPHTAVAWTVAERLATDAPVLIVSTAHWSKFAADVARGLSGVPDGAPLDEPDDFALLDRVVELAPGARIPASLEAVRSRPARFDTRIAGRRDDLERALLAWLANGG
jgi:threonine synthase